MQRSVLVLIATAMVALAGCPNPSPRPVSGLSTNAMRFEVISAQAIVCSRGKSRDILVLRDKETGREYLAVMGAGVGEMYQSGKTQHEE